MLCISPMGSVGLLEYEPQYDVCLPKTILSFFFNGHHSLKSLVHKFLLLHPCISNIYYSKETFTLLILFHSVSASPLPRKNTTDIQFSIFSYLAKKKSRLGGTHLLSGYLGEVEAARCLSSKAVWTV